MAMSRQITFCRPVTISTQYLSATTTAMQRLAQPTIRYGATTLETTGWPIATRALLTRSASPISTLGKRTTVMYLERRFLGLLDRIMAMQGSLHISILSDPV